MSPTRDAVLPALPTALEQGLPDVDADGWNAYFFPNGTPEPIVRKLNAGDVSRLLDIPGGPRARLGKPRPQRRAAGAAHPDYLGKLVASELDEMGSDQCAPAA